MDNQMDREKLQKMLDAVSPNLGETQQKQVREAMQSGSIDHILKNLRPQDSKKLQQVLSDKAAAQRLLATPQAQMLLKKLMEDKK